MNSFTKASILFRLRIMQNGNNGWRQVLQNVREEG